MSELTDKYSKNFSPSKKKAFEKRVFDNLGNMSEYVAASIGGANNGIFEDALSEWSSQFNYGQYYFQFKDDNQNMMYDVGEIYAVSLENGINGEIIINFSSQEDGYFLSHTVS